MDLIVPLYWVQRFRKEGNGKSSFGRTRTGAEVTSSLSFMKEYSWGKPQMNLTSFMVKPKSARAWWENPGMKRR
jgi:hypothetical protein